jgi:S-adenosylmethionine:tRNA ribosyltransferase-isomerase
MLRTEDLDYPLPEELIATTPAEPRDSARLLVVSRSDPKRLEHRTVRELPEILSRSPIGADLMVVNATRVLPARFMGVRSDTGGKAEGLYVENAPGPSGVDAPEWIVLLKMRRMKPGVVVKLLSRDGTESGLQLTLIDRAGEDGAAWRVTVSPESNPIAPGTRAPGLLERIGLTPIPPYIRAARRDAHLEVADDRDRATYQTVYANDRGERAGCGSVAAPTAGLHFTPELLTRLANAGVARAEVTLDVGLGTFKSVETEYVEQHPMHAEWCSVPEETAKAITRLRDAGPSGRIIAIGTTAARTLESFASPEEMLSVGSKETRLLITPGYAFKHVDVLMTNFHLPKSTLMAMVAAMLVAPGSNPGHAIERLRSIYAEAVRERYRFYSYGDAMLILP